MHRLIISSALALLLTASANAAEPETHQILLNLPARGTIHYTVVRDSQKANNGQTHVISVSYAFDDNYTSEDETFTILPNFTALTLNNLDGHVPPKGVDTSSFTAPYGWMNSIGYTADNSLRPVKIAQAGVLRNKLKTFMLPAVAQQHPEMAGKPILGTTVEAAVAATFDVLGDEDLADAYLPEARLLSWPHNTALELGKPVTQQLEGEMPESGVPMSTTMSMTLDSWDEAKGIAEISWSWVPDEDSLTAAVKSSMPLLFAKLGASKDEIAKVPVDRVVVKKESHCHYQMSLATGLVNKADCTISSGITIDGKGQLQTDHFVMTESLAE